ncbi:MAG TPA: polyribonucleotide nucleotidyltransferase, partial [Vicinamibacteria bacterium]|nr:polyribonucleotide nucleotidyltransferase [Vicinamibacteria bacterium]
MTMQRVEMPLGRHTLSIETGRLAKQSDGAVLVRLGDTVVLATANGMKDAKAGVDFLPLTVDYRENTYAAGKIPGGFFKREGRPNEKEILTSRMIDRPLRPLFPEGYNNETQVVALLLSADQENDGDTLAITGASCALYLSSIPFTNPVAAVRVGYVDGQVVVNPSSTDLRTKSELNLLVAGTADAIVMVESGAKEISEEVMVQALQAGHDAIKQIVALIRDLQGKVGKEKWTVAKKDWDPALLADAESAMSDPLLKAMQTKGKILSYGLMKQVKDEYMARFGPEDPSAVEKKAQVPGIYEHLREKIMRREILENGRRHDGRKFDEIRPIHSEVGVLPRT